MQKLPRKDPIVKKSYFCISNPSGPSNEFTKHAYELVVPNDVHTVLIHYIGNEKCAISYAHGNTTSEFYKREYL